MIARPRLRPLGLSELLDESFRLYRQYFVVFVAIAALVLVPFALINMLIQIPLQSQLAAFQPQNGSGLDPLGGQSVWEFFGSLVFVVLGSVGISLIYTILLQPLMEGALARAVSQSYLAQPVSVGDSFGTAMRNILGLVAARLLPALLTLLGFGLIAGITFGVTLMIVGTSLFTQDIGSLFGATIAPLLLFFGTFVLFVGLIIFGVILTVRLIFTSQAIVIEGRGPLEGIRRSWALTQGYFWRTLGYLMTIGLLVFIISAVSGAVLSVPLQILLSDQLMLQTLLNTVVGTLLNVIITPFGLIAYTLMYYDLRIRKEGFDLEHQAMQQMLGPNAPQLGTY